MMMESHFQNFLTPQTVLCCLAIWLGLCCMYWLVRGKYKFPVESPGKTLEPERVASHAPVRPLNMEPQHLLLFGDHTTDSFQSLQNLLRRSSSSALLQKFLRDVTDMVQIEISKLNSDERERFSAFSSLLELAEHHAPRTDADDLISIVLVYIAQIGDLILLAECNPEILGSSGAHLHILGISTGLLAAFVAGIARNANDAVEIGLELVVVAIRLACQLSRRSKGVEDSHGRWAVTISGISTEELAAIIDEFHRRCSVPGYRHAYISVVTDNSPTVSAPPSVLEQLLSFSSRLKNCSRLELEIRVGLHASHLPLPDVDQISGPLSFGRADISSKARIFSTSKCQPFSTNQCGALLNEILKDIVQQTSNLDSLTKSAIRTMERNEDVRLHVLGPVTHESLIQTLLEARNVTRPQIGLYDPPLMPDTRGGSGLIAIVGMSGRFPEADNLQDFWNVLRAGKDLHKQIPENRFSVDAAVAQYGCFLKSPGLFDNRMFNFSPREALQTDPIHRLLLMTSHEALEMAGYSRNSTLSSNSKRIATYFGQATDDWRETYAIRGAEMYSVSGLSRAFASGRVNFCNKWDGAAFSVDSACASGLSTVTLACSALIARECDMALAGGGNLITSPFPHESLSKAGFLSPSGGCKTFSENADGYCRGEGVAVVVLKRLEDAIAENDNIQAIIRGSGRNSSGNALSITQPEAKAQQRLYKEVLHRASLEATSVGYVEMHGTGTQVGDLIEMTSVTNVFGQARAKENPLIVGAVKANVGHGEAAAGVIALIKTILMLRENTIPPQPRISTRINSKFPQLEDLNVHIAKKCTPFKARPGTDGKRRILVNNFDAAGGNTCLLIEDPPARVLQGYDPRSFHVVTCSARTSSSLQMNKQRLLAYIRSHPLTRLSDLSYTTTARRMHDHFPAAYSARTLEGIAQLIDSDLTKPTETKRNTSKKLTVFVFTGQGTQYAGMGKDLFKSCSKFRETIISCQRICDCQGFPSFLDLIANGTVDVKARTTVQIQLAIVSLEIALADLWKSWGLRPDYLIGHSLGEYAALYVSGVLSVDDTLYLVGRRATMVEEKCARGEYAMLAVKSTQQIIQREIDTGNVESCQISCRNTLDSTVVSGTSLDIEQLQRQLLSSGIKAMLLEVPFGFHSPQMDVILSDLETTAKGVHFGKPLVPIISTLKATIVADAGVFDASYLAKQARSPVDFVGALQACKFHGIAGPDTVWLEIGPEPVCLGMIRSSLEVLPGRLLSTLTAREDNYQTISGALTKAYMSGLAINWPEFHKEYTKSLKLLELPTYAFDLKEYWISHPSSNAAKSKPALSHLVQEISPPGFSTTTLQSVERRSFLDDFNSVTFLSKVSDQQLFDAIQGHRINGVALCPSSVYCDMAFTAAKYIHMEAYPRAPLPAMSLNNLDISNPLVVPDRASGQVIRVMAVRSAETDWSVQVTFGSDNGSAFIEHGACHVVFGDKNEWKIEVERASQVVKSRMAKVIEAAKTGHVHRMLKPMVYKLFQHVVHYDLKYQGLQEVFLDGEYGDAVASVRLGSAAGTGTFTYSPYWTDGIIHLAGFVLNCNFSTPDDVVYMSTGFESIRIVDTLSETKSYVSYVFMRAEEKAGDFVGDVYVFEGESTVAMCAGVKFKKMKKKVLHALLSRGTPSGTVGSEITSSHIDATMSKTAFDHLAMQQHHEPVSSQPALQQRHCPDVAEVLIAAVASETGFDLADVEPSSTFSDMGVDSLMGIAVIEVVHKESGVVLPASFFSDHPTVADVLRDLGNKQSSGSPPQAKMRSAALLAEPKELPYMNDTTTPSYMNGTTTPPHMNGTIVPPYMNGTATSNAIESVRPFKDYKSRVVLVQGRPHSNQTPLFLLTDGAGSATAYIQLPSFKSGLPVYALESPFLENPTEFTCGVTELCTIFLASIRKTQPHGPYMIGGWSAGAVYAYEVSRRLLEDGEEVLGLILMDMRVPRLVADSLEPTMDLIDRLAAGVMRGTKPLVSMSLKLRQMLLHSVKALRLYDPIPMPSDRRPAHTVVIWAAFGLGRETNGTVSKGQAPPKSRATGPAPNFMEDSATGLKPWFFAPRDDFGPNGWEKLLGPVECHVVRADHFSMMSPPHAKKTGELMENAITKFLA